MRRIVGVVISGLLLASLTGPASAGSLKVRFDPNDSGSPDIRKVSSDFTSSHVYLQVRTWGRVMRRDQGLGFYLLIRLDTVGSPRVDLDVEINFLDAGGLACFVFDVGDVIPGYSDRVGVRRASRTRNTVTCNLPRRWFGEVHRAVRFSVRSYADRAPDEGMYRWL